MPAGYTARRIVAARIGSGEACTGYHSGVERIDEQRLQAWVAGLVEPLRQFVSAKDEAALTLRRLAGELGLVPNALYRYFPSREVLVAAVADEVARRLVERATGALTAHEAAAGLRGLDPAVRIRILAEVYAGFGDEHPALYETLTADRSEAEATLPRPLGHDLLWELVIGTLAPFTGEMAAPAAAVTLWGLLHGLWSLQRANLLGGKKPTDIAPFAIDALLKGINRVKPIIQVIDVDIQKDQSSGFAPPVS